MDANDLQQTRVSLGNYVLATKYNDGDPNDHWAIGFHTETRGDRHIVVNASGTPFRANGFRRVKEISKERGAWLLAHREQIELSGKSLWFWEQQDISAND